MDAINAMAASGLQSRTESLDVLANNLANSGTAGYKADEESYNLYFGPDAWDGYLQDRPPAGEMPVAQQSWTDLSQGTLMDTGNSSDLALRSAGFFAVRGPSGTLYTRTGHLKVSQQGVLTTADGYPMLGRNGAQINIDATQSITVAPDGAVVQNGNEIAQLGVVTIARSNLLKRHGSAYFSADASAGITPANNPDIAQGKIEASNVETSQSAVKIVSVLRQFEMLQKAVHIASDMDRESVEQVAKVSA